MLNDDNDESRRAVEQCYRTRKTLVNPIIDWEDEDVWEFLNNVAKVQHCELYDRGYKRLGCIGCPMTGHIREELDKYPKYKGNYMRAFERMLDAKTAKRMKPSWETPEDVLNWWAGGDSE